MHLKFPNRKHSSLHQPKPTNQQQQQKKKRSKLFNFAYYTLPMLFLENKVIPRQLRVVYRTQP